MVEKAKNKNTADIFVFNCAQLELDELKSGSGII